MQMHDDDRATETADDRAALSPSGCKMLAAVSALPSSSAWLRLRCMSTGCRRCAERNCRRCRVRCADALAQRR